MEKQRPYWLSTGSETCHGCTHAYVYQMELRCTGCDRGTCTHCAIVVHETREVWCAECFDTEREA